MNKLFVILFFSPLFLQAQSVQIKMGGATFIDCQTLVGFGNQKVLSIRQVADGAWLLDADVYNEAGRLSASVRDSKTSAAGVVVTQRENEILLSDKYTGRKICQFQIGKSADGKSVLLGTTLNMYLPNGAMMQCTPEASNQTVLETMRGTTVTNRQVGLQLN